jgi:hypothetical protein
MRHSVSRRLILSLLVIVACGWSFWASGRTALSRLLVKYGMATANAEAFDAAIRLTPVDAEGHYGKAELANYLFQPAAALPEMELAVSLRPRDYALWLELGMTRDQLDDQNGALAAFNESVRLAPDYAKPRWQRGNLLFRLGRHEEAFLDLQRAVGSDPSFLPGLIDLSWGASNHDPVVTEKLLGTQNDGGHLALAFFFAKQGQPKYALSQFAQVKSAREEQRRDLVQALAAAGSFSEAFIVWSNGPGGTPGSVTGAIYDGSFERSLTFDAAGFGWRPLRSVPAVNLSLDQNTPHTGARSLRVDFNGDSDPDAAILTQLVLVQPNSQYKLSFAALTRNLVTGGAPLIVVSDSTNQPMVRLGNSKPLTAGAEQWQVNTLEFRTGLGTKAVTFSLQREHCRESPCPIFGSLNLDSFELERVSQPAKD